MNKWMKRKIDNLRSQLQRQELQLDVARDRNDDEEITRLELQVEATKGEMVRIISS